MDRGGASAVPRRRELLARAALPTAGILAVLALILGGLRVTVLDSQRFSDGVASSLSRGSVDTLLARRITERLIQLRPGLQGVEPVLEPALAASLRSGPARALVRVAADQFHRVVVGGDRNAGALILANTAVFAVQALGALRPELAGKVPEDLAVQVLSLRSDGAGATLNTIAHTAGTLRVALWFGLAAALALFALAVVLAPERGRMLVRAGLTAALAGLLAAGLFELVIVLAPGGLPGGMERAAGRAVLDSVLGGAVTLCLAVALAAAVAAVCVRTLIEHGRLDTAALAAGRRLGASAAGRAALALVAAALGLLLLLAPEDGGRLIAALLGAGLLLAGIERLARAGSELGLPPLPGRPARPRPPAWAGPVVLGLAGLVGAALWAAGSTAAPAAGEGGCNGSQALCSRRLDQVVFPATHNSFSAARDGFLFANQRTGIQAQLAGGIRGLLIDTHPGVKTAKGVYTVLPEDPKSRAKLEQTIGRQATATAEALRAQLGYRGGGAPQVYLCHAFCEIGATPALGALTEIRDFLIEHPGVVLVISVEDGTSPKAFAEVVRQSGLLALVWQGPLTPVPTLGQMVASGQRVLFMVEGDPGAYAWLHPQFRVAQETPYDFRTPEELLGPAGCRPNRGGTAPPLFLINDFVESATPSPKPAETLNDTATLAAHARRCAAERHRTPTLLAVDQWQVGNVVAAARELNASPEPGA